MTIEERAKDYAGYNIHPLPDIYGEMRMVSAREDFKAGAEWMLEKALDWIGDNVVFDKFGRPVDGENFRKAMEE